VQIARHGERAQIVVVDRKTGRRNTLDADLVICTIPLSVLKSIPADFSPDVKEAIGIGAGCMSRW